MSDENTINEAYKWWNNQINSISEKSTPPKIVTAIEASSIFYHILPILYIFDDFVDNNDAYWAELYHFLCSRFCTIKITHPKENFPEFIQVLFTLKDNILIIDLNECFDFLQSYRTAEPAFFLIRKFPVLLKYPKLYFETFIHLQNNNQQLWNILICDYKFTDYFFQMNHNSFNYFRKNDSKSCEMVLLCSQALSIILSQALRHHSKLFTIISSYFKDAQFIVSHIRFG